MQGMIIRDVQLETVCGVTSVLPRNAHPEVAFAGKSNVGKSSLINGLLNRRSLARTSAQPGKTQTINFYRVDALDRQENDQERKDTLYDLYLVDLPGYGYAKASEKAKREWAALIERYLHGSAQLRCVFLLIDIRHAPGANDIQMYRWIRTGGYRPVIIATKLDKIKRSQLQKQLKLIKDTLQVSADTLIIPFSAQTRQGRDQIWETIVSLSAPEMQPAGDADESREIPEDDKYGGNHE